MGIRNVIRRLIIEQTGIDYARKVAEEVKNLGAQDVDSIQEHPVKDGYKIIMKNGFAYNVLNPEDAMTFRGNMDVEVEERGSPFGIVEVPIDHPRRAAKKIFDHFIENNDRPRM